ncbi:hypothetical protein WJX72_008715 [[Myrmecia] bisecta]|uniref:ubiquitinyl hydrolase 1 n=1 Tax=[Myrmecia] bisecta TaxID=41462 RepID=A0AAW1QFV5_9CHLO
MESDSVLLYHEKQEAALCGVHCLNTLLQAPIWSAYDLSQIAHDLDQQERELMEPGWLEDSGNVDDSGMFSIQVLSKALSVWGLACESMESPEMRHVWDHPEHETAFLCNLQLHWFTVRIIQGSWWNFNSLFPAPQPLSAFHLCSFLGTLKEQGYTIFAVRGRLPAADRAAGGPGKWFTPAEAKQANEGAAAERQTGYAKAALEGLMEQASQGGNMISLKRRRPPMGSSGIDNDDDDDEDMARAIAASLRDSGQDGASGSNAEFDIDPELAEAIAASLAHQPSGPAGTAPAAEPSAGLDQLCADAGKSHTVAVAAADPEPEPGAGVQEVAVRLPTGSRITRRFRANDPVQTLADYLQIAGVDMTKHTISTQYPKKVLSDMTQTLRQAGVADKELLTVQKA